MYCQTSRVVSRRLGVCSLGWTRRIATLTARATQGPMGSARCIDNADGWMRRIRRHWCAVATCRRARAARGRDRTHRGDRSAAQRRDHPLVRRGAQHAHATFPTGRSTACRSCSKDLWAHYAGQPLTNGCQALKEALPLSPADTTLVARFRRPGSTSPVAPTAPSSAACRPPSRLAWGPTRNPWNLDHSPGGSSGGSAAAVAAGMVPFAHASDGGGSIRIPASCCGLVGLKPSQGRITLGPFRDESNLGVELCVSRTVRDTAALLDAVHGPGVGDTVIAPPPLRPYVDEAGRGSGSPAHRPARRPPVGRARCTTTAAMPPAQPQRCSNRSVTTSSTASPRRWPTATSAAGSRRCGAPTWACRVQRIETQLGRALSDDDVEPVNRAQVAVRPAMSAPSTMRSRSLRPSSSAAPSSSGGPTDGTCC